MAAATTNTNATANKATAATEQVTQATAKMVEETTNQAKANAEKIREGATKLVEETTKRFEENAEKARQNATKMADENTKRFEEITKGFGENSERVKELNADLVKSSKAGSLVVVDNYAKAAKSVLAMQRQMVGETKVQWVQDSAMVQIQFAEDVTEAWAKAARELLK